MKISNIQEFDMNTEPFVIKYNANEVGDSSVSDTYLEVTGLGEGMEISAVGFVLNHSAGIPMKLASISDIGVADTITKDGIYLVLSNSLERLELHCTGSCHIIIKQVM